MSKNIIAKATEILSKHAVHSAAVEKIPFCFLAMTDFDGSPTVSTITAAKVYGIREIMFCTGMSSNKVKRLALGNRASVCFGTETYNITLVGRLELVTAQNVKSSMWYDALSQHFTGPEDAEYCVLKFTTIRYNLLVDWEESRGNL